jgi:outer membrane biosynthesis protein TonB
MKKLLFFLLSVVLIGSVGCGSNKDLSVEVTDAGSTEVVNETVEPTTEAVTVEMEDTETAQPESTEAVKEVDSSADKKDTSKGNQSDNIASDEKTADNKQSEESKSPDSQKSEEQPKDTKSEPASEQQPKTEDNSKPEEKPKEKPEPKPEPQAVSYSPERVVSLAISKCQAGGMVTTEQHLKDNLNAGKITQEEYDEYYPLDGLEDSYYSVFVNVDLNKAATTSGRTLGSEEEIAQYIADMLLLESDSVFNIRYTGTTKTSGETFYEFRCYR